MSGKRVTTHDCLEGRWMLCVRMTNALCYRSASSLIIVLMNALPRPKKKMKKKANKWRYVSFKEEAAHKPARSQSSSGSKAIKKIFGGILQGKKPKNRTFANLKSVLLPAYDVCRVFFWKIFRNFPMLGGKFSAHLHFVHATNTQKSQSEDVNVENFRFPQNKMFDILSQLFCVFVVKLDTFSLSRGFIFKVQTFIWWRESGSVHLSVSNRPSIDVFLNAYEQLFSKWKI